MTAVTKLEFGPAAVSWADLREAARTASSPMLWIVAADAEPEPGALDALRDAGTTPAFSLPVDHEGAPVEALIGRLVDEHELLLAAASRRQLPLRNAPVTSVLCDRELVLALEPPDPARFGAYATIEWSARLLARRPGVLVTASRVRAGPPAAVELRSVLHMLRASAWGPADAVRALRGFRWRARGPRRSRPR